MESYPPKKTPSKTTLEHLKAAKEERGRQNEIFLQAALSDLTKDSRAENLIHLFNPPERSETNTLHQNWEESFKAFTQKVREAINESISKDEAVLIAALDAGEVLFPPNILDDSIRVANDGGNLDNLIELYKRKVSEGGLSRQSIIKTLGCQHPQIPLLLEIIEKGARLTPSPDFVPIIYPSPTRNLEVNLGHTILKAYLSLHSEHKGIIIDPRVLNTNTFLQKSYVDNHWTTKVEKGVIVPPGRITIDPSNPPPGIVPLNGEYQKEKASEIYGQPHTPLFSDMIRELLYCVLVLMD